MISNSVGSIQPGVAVGAIVCGCDWGGGGGLKTFMQNIQQTAKTRVKWKIKK